MNKKIAATSFMFFLCLHPTFGQTAAEGSPAPLFEGMGNLHHPITSRSPEVQRYFDQGLTLCFAFNHTEAIRSFKAAAARDPDCAMAFWGIAYASGPHVNKPMTQEETVRAWEALQKAIALKSKVSPKEQAYIDVMAKRYQSEFTPDRSALDKAYAVATREMVRQDPDDLDAQALLAEALMDTMPWDYWLKDRSPKPETEEALRALRYVMARNPEHPGANHFYIHAVEAGSHPELGLPAADRLLQFAPSAGHLVHMPGHIYIRVGQYEDAVRANVLAIKADQDYLRQCRAQGFYPGVYYPHNVHFLWYAHLFQGQSAEALAAAQKAVDYAKDKSCGPSQVLEAPRFRHLPWLTQARFGQWDRVLQAPQPPATESFLIDRIMWHYVRGLAFAAQKKTDDAAREESQMLQFTRGEEVKKLDNPHLPVTWIIVVPEHLLAGKVAASRNDHRAAIEHFRKAVEAEDALPYMEPAFWPIPTRPTLGAALLQAGDSAEAEKVFRKDLELFPRNGWGLFGLEQCLRQQGKTQAAESVHREFERAWKRADAQLNLNLF